MSTERLQTRLLRVLPGIGWRDAEIARARDQIAELSRTLKQKDARLRAAEAEARTLRRLRATDAERPLFRREIHSTRRLLTSLTDLSAMPHPAGQFEFKLATHRFAQSHGVPVPDLYGVWSSTTAITTDGLPDEFVLKSDQGASTRGVLILERQPDGRFLERLSGANLDDASARERLDHARAVHPPFFAEQLLHGVEAGPIPTDVKLYTFYGEIGHVLLVGRGTNTVATYRYLDEHGADLGDIGKLAVDASIAVPRDLPALCEMARHVSRAVGLPFCRVDLYETDHGPVLGEVTPAPGGTQIYESAHAEHLGSLWERARTRLELDLSAGRPFGRLIGPHPAADPYVGATPPWGPELEPPAVPSCDLWCRPGSRGEGPD